MPYITSIERLGREEGLQQGRQEGAIIRRQRDVLDALEIRFGAVADEVRRRIDSIQDEARLRSLLKSAIQAVSIEEFESDRDPGQPWWATLPDQLSGVGVPDANLIRGIARCDFASR